MKVDAKCESCGNLSSLNIPDDKAASGKNIDVQWKCKGCGTQNVFKLRTNNASSTVSESKEQQPAAPQKKGRLQALGKYPCCKVAL
jgi:RNase P subunit RPR2